MATSPPGSPGNMLPPRPVSALVKPSSRSNSRMSMTSKAGGGSRASDEDGGRTAVKVAVRVRPPLKPSDPGYDLIPQRFQRSMVQTTSDTTLSIDAPQGKKLFVFDRVFGPETTQEGVWEYLHESVNAFLQGYNVSVLAYGQSGAGKSFTMGTSGPEEQDNLESMGVVSRAATALFERLEGSPRPSNRNSMSQLRTPARYSLQSPTSRGEKNWQLRATYVEIYNEQLRDLLLPETVQPHERAAVMIREDQKGNILLTGLRQWDINSVDDLLNALNFGSSIRQTDATAINAKSSRSHAVFSLNLILRKNRLQAAQGKEKRMSVPLEAMTGSADSWVTTDSKLHFVDLAGSERMKNTGAQGERAKEGISINAGLASLGKVISQLSSRQAGSHVSYRDSKLTRLLQDSLGGNAITYMIACVTPAEFHLSESLNTVQYAQRARAIQSKPRIQQIEEGDKQAIIERLKAEVAFLREQIRSAERGGVERRKDVTGDRSERQNEREAELQNQLLDTQENYNTLNQRYAKLITEVARARDNEVAAENQHLDDTLGETATARLDRSSSFAQAVEQVLLEYEKTIQTLEQSLSSTRTTLSTTEATLLEKETKCVYIETINTQLQARLHKLMDREANTENYLHDLETKLDGHTTGEEKNAAIVIELRKEIARIRENEAACEDYISTLEERLAEADQDQELMQREIDRLEQVVERQRSLGKLDSLLYELDHIKEEGKQNETSSENSEVGQRRSFSERLNKPHTSRPSQALKEKLPEVAEGAEEESNDRDQSEEFAEEASERAEKEDVGPAETTGIQEPEVTKTNSQSHTQNQVVNDKLEDVTQELVALRLEHESTVNEFDVLHAKYEDALRILSELQDQIDEARHPNRQRDSMVSANSPIRTRPPSFLSDSRSGEAKDGMPLSSRSLSSELSSAMESPTTLDTIEAEVPKASESSETITEESPPSDVLAAELDRLKALAFEKELAEKQLADKYAELEDKHQEALDMVEELKTEVMKAKYAEPPSPRTGTPVIRRKSSQNMMIIDRAHRSFASLRNIATENFEERPEVMQNFELNLNSAMHELHARSERIQELEADITNTKKEMETKMTIITGLTRERNSLNSTPLDISMVATMREQLEKNEKQLREAQDLHMSREKELMGELEALRTSVNEAAEVKSMSAPHSQEISEQETQLRLAHEKKISELESELSSWESKHHTALEAMQATERQMKSTIEELEAQVTAVNVQFEETRDKVKLDAEAETKHKDLVEALRNEINEYRAVVNSNAAKVAELENAHSSTKSQLEEAYQSRELAVTEADKHKGLMSKLEQQLEEHQQAVKDHEQSLQDLRSRYAEDLEGLRGTSKADYDSQLEVVMSEHAENIKLLESDIAKAREELMKVATQVAEALGVDVSVEKISERIYDLIEYQKALGDERQRRVELEGHIQELSTINNTIMRDLENVKSSLNDMLLVDGESMKSPYPSVSEQLAIIKKKMTDLENKNKKHSRLVEELEDQLQTNYDQAQITTNRLSTLQTERNSQLEEATVAKLRAEAELTAIREELAILQRTSSTNSQVRKTSSMVSLPSPPPAIPLPPLPAGGSTSPSQAVSPTPPPGRPASNDIAMAQIREDQEARIRSLDRALNAERQLTATLEEALSDLESQSKKVKTDCDAWKKRAQDLESENKDLKSKPQDSRWRDSLHQVEEERKKRQDAERAARHLEERMNAINQKKKKKGSLNCF